MQQERQQARRGTVGQQVGGGVLVGGQPAQPVRGLENAQQHAVNIYAFLLQITQRALMQVRRVLAGLQQQRKRKGNRLFFEARAGGGLKGGLAKSAVGLGHVEHRVGRLKRRGQNGKGALRLPHRQQAIADRLLEIHIAANLVEREVGGGEADGLPIIVVLVISLYLADQRAIAPSAALAQRRHLAAVAPGQREEVLLAAGWLPLAARERNCIDGIFRQPLAVPFQLQRRLLHLFAEQVHHLASRAAGWPRRKRPRRR